MKPTISAPPGMSQPARDTGLARPALYRAFSPDGHPEFETVLKVPRALGATLKPTVVEYFGKALAG